MWSKIKRRISVFATFFENQLGSAVLQVFFGFFVGFIGTREPGHIDAPAFQQIGNGKDLQPGMLAPGRCVKARRSRFFAHGLGGRVHEKQHADGGFLPFENAQQDWTRSPGLLTDSYGNL